MVVQHRIPLLPPPEVKNCTSVAACSTISGCCLRGRCSKSGNIFDRCYVRESHNGRAQFHEVWTRSDLCPCASTFTCLDVDSGDIHPEHGPRGFCMPGMG
ncbi:hypothetical protein PoB_000186000 [Plakobranchus ocellatus]|uniref:Prokineticin domain-containing protein n=1 Tax=Plakobranchus ocellatus TaxID=259542 RepID=A0AAV3XY66_9GAST|nr:hypothetical protein PoB_000186000 [Plakobranchus ocellatus]